MGLGVNSSVHLCDRVCSEEAREKLRVELDIDTKEVIRLAKLMDFCWLRYMNPDFAQL
ncbi:hypothetical protein OAT16_09925 [Prolixibacteraceae bacterium]|nr:hypothetical protein [Prolixibacteraceae bacterium]